MHSYIFKSKLKKLNPSLYLKEDRVVERSKEVRASGIYSRDKRRTDQKTNYNQLDADATRWLSAKEAGDMDTFITGCPTSWIPERDEMDVETGRILNKGWRTVILYLVKERFCTLQKARQVFSSSLGDTDWDRWGYDARLSALRKDAGYKSASQLLGAKL